MAVIGIYKITSPSQRIYIGQSINIEKRWKEYSVTKLKSQPKIKNSILKYGIKNHNLIQKFKSGKEASRILSLHQTNINSCCNNKVKTCGGFIFKFK